MPVETDILLTRTQEGDGPELIRDNLASRSYHLPWSDPFVDQTGFDGWFARTYTDRYVSLIARHRDSRRIIGLINFSEIAQETEGSNFQNADTGYYAMAAFAGQGLMTQALKAAARFAFEELKLHRVEANIRPENIKSIALVKRVGFRMEGFSPNYLFLDGAWQSHERWAMTRENAA